MKAGYQVIKEILDSIDDKEGDTVFEKFALRYKNDGELQGIYSLYVEGGNMKQVRERLISLYDIRRFRSGGTHLSLKDRRHLTDHRGMEDY
jgi:hypothetical protein